MQAAFSFEKKAVMQGGKSILGLGFFRLLEYNTSN